MVNPLKNKERLAIPRQEMPARPPEYRCLNFAEVNLGLDSNLAKTESLRCLECKKPTCMEGCPVGVKIADFVALILKGDYLGAAAKIREDNILPAVTGRVCPQEYQCESSCLLIKKVSPLAIGNLERFVADYEQEMGSWGMPPIAPATGKKVAIVGSGPAGLACAGDLVQKGHQVRVFEALHELGGVLIYGIPEFRLPKDIMRYEIDCMRKMGVEFETNVVIGKTVTVDELFENEGFNAIFVATGAGLPQFLQIPGEHLNGVYSANEFLTRVNLMRGYRFPEHDSPVYNCVGRDVVVIGGGNTALDSVRTAIRLGAKSASIFYRRSEAEMPARKEEGQHAKEEGVEFHFLCNPVEFLGNKDGKLRSARIVRMQLAEPDASGRRKPVEIAGSEFEIATSMAIIAAGTSANPIIRASTPDIRTNRWGYIDVRPGSQKTSKPGVFAGGDIVTGGATVILAMGAGRKAAHEIHDFLTTGIW